MKVIPIMVRILPMDKHNEFKEQEIEEVQEGFFLKDLPYRKDEYGTGKFLYKKSAMNAEPAKSIGGQVYFLDIEWLDMIHC